MDDAESVEDAALQAVQRYRLETKSDGSISGECWTNDNGDRGVPSEEASWPVRYKSFEAMRRATGLTHIGMNGCQVTVTLDGVKV